MSRKSIELVALLGFAGLDEGFASFEVEGLVIVGQDVGGAPESVVAVTGTLVAAVPLESADAVFLIRIATLRGTNPAGAEEGWPAIAERSLRPD